MNSHWRLHFALTSFSYTTLSKHDSQLLIPINLYVRIVVYLKSYCFSLKTSESVGGSAAFARGHSEVTWCAPQMNQTKGLNAQSLQRDCLRNSYCVQQLSLRVEEKVVLKTKAIKVYKKLSMYTGVHAVIHNEVILLLKQKCQQWSCGWQLKTSFHWNHHSFTEVMLILGLTRCFPTMPA